MVSFQEWKRRSIIPLAGVGLAAYYILVFSPLHRRAESLEAPLDKGWQKLSTSLEQPRNRPIDFLHITNQLAETRQALASLETAKSNALLRLEIGPLLKARLATPFSLVDYEEERSRLMDGLGKRAKQDQITLDPPVLAGFPEHTADTTEPALLWAELSFLDAILKLLVQEKVTAIHALEVPLSLTNTLPSEPSSRWVEIPVQFEFSAPYSNAWRLVRSLPLRADELRAAGLSAPAPDKPVMYLDRLAVRRVAPEKADEVRVWLRVAGFVFRE